ncbi:CHRD domain-containing protein [Herbaspirillum sp. HC18]|nr:CHRD domain-containing protein [Herbaspirillum sp. HC18]
MSSHRFSSWRTAAFAAILLAACGGGHDDLPLALSAKLTGIEQVPPNASPAVGSGVVTVDSDRAAFTASVIVLGPATGEVHIHAGLPGSAGPALFLLTRVPGTSAWTTRTALNEAQLAALKAGNFYFDLHTPVFPNGEIRGQIVWLLPAEEQLALLHQVSTQSPEAALQLEQVQQILDDGNGHFTGIGVGITFGF